MLDRAKWDRWGAAGGVAFVVLLLIGFFLPGEEPPGHEDPNTAFVHYVLSNHTELLFTGILGGLAFIAFLWFLGSLVKAMRDAGEGRLGTIAFSGGIGATALAFVGLAIGTAVSYRIAKDDPTSVKAWFDLDNVVFTLISFPVTALTFATGIAALRSGFLPRWFGFVSGVVSVPLVFAGGALVAEGFYAPDGEYSFITFLIFLAWMLAASYLLIRRAGESEAS